MLQLEGIIPPIVTPMNADESVDLAGLRKHIDHMLSYGVQGIFKLKTVRPGSGKTLYLNSGGY